MYDTVTVLLVRFEIANKNKSKNKFTCARAAEYNKFCKSFTKAMIGCSKNVKTANFHKQQKLW